MPKTKTVKQGDEIMVLLHGHGEKCGEDCCCNGDNKIKARVVEVLKEGFVKAEITDQAHPLAMVDDKKRILTVGPEMYEGL